METESVNPRSAAGPNNAVVLKVDNGKGGFYTFTAEDIEKMKSTISKVVEHFFAMERARFYERARINEKAAEVCTLKVQIYKDRKSFPDCEITEFVANGQRVARISPDAYNTGKWCAMMGLSFEARNYMNYADAVAFVRNKIEDDLQTYGIKVEFVEQ